MRVAMHFARNSQGAAVLWHHSHIAQRRALVLEQVAIENRSELGAVERDVATVDVDRHAGRIVEHDRLSSARRRHG